MTTSLRELLGKATKGPWEAENILRNDQRTIIGPKGYCIGAVWDVSGLTENEANAALIVEAVNSLPALLNALDEARGALVGVENCLNQMSVTAYNIRLEGTKDWDQIAGGADLYGTRDKVREALSKINEVIK